MPELDSRTTGGGREEQFFHHIARTAEEMQLFLQKIKRELGIQEKVDCSMVRMWASQIRFLGYDVNVSQEPTPNWTAHDRLIIVMRICQEMEIFLRGSRSDSIFVTWSRAKNWAERLEMVVNLSYSDLRLEAHREDLLGHIDPH